MNPVDARPEDWNMYYSGAWMYHNKIKRIVYVEVGQLAANRFSYQLPAGEIWHDAEPEELQSWWPRAGSYNVGNGAVFIGRRARRSMRKSATNDHYFIQWGGRGVSPCKIMATNSEFIKYDAAVEVLNKKVSKSAAICQDVILSKKEGQGKNVFDVIYRGTGAGVLDNNRFIPTFEGTPASKRAEYRLVKEGVPCI